ncbi:THUMP domain-containing class I SAM-dependent RNA methyltransferase [Marinilactibacillus piezotolerans]|uniref:THUMP domain-containing class I SAM-dependent RNA methyltransferase n=1 Tax=Marinilactibacillus piezotolerans TaxID=258723 RepID=UPI0009B15DF6|nr:class I SAM-dependent RNA methyltransferase [Marinilactibacillus piezotolerans]
MSYKLLATAASGLEALVGKELKSLGYATQVENGRVRFEGEIEDIAKTNLWLRTADRVKIIVGEFEAKTFDDLFEKTKALPWDQLLPLDAAFPVSGKSHKSTLYSVPDVQRIVNKAIADKLKEVYHRRGMLPESGAKYPIEVAILKDKVLLTIDTTGPSLFKRGYRVDRKGAAPLKENMAAALVMLTTWRKDRPFVDPVCGSGTIAIEAALIGHNIAPGFNRSFLCEGWDWMPKDMWAAVRQEADDQADYDAELDILGTDIDHNMIEIAKENAMEAGLSHSIEFKQMQVADFKTDKEFGIIVANPPYGERLGDEEAAAQIYRDMGKAFKPLDTWSKYIITSDLDFEKHYGEKATKKRKLYNGYLRTDYFQYWGKRK